MRHSTAAFETTASLKSRHRYRSTGTLRSFVLRLSRRVAGHRSVARQHEARSNGLQQRYQGSFSATAPLRGLGPRPRGWRTPARGHLGGSWFGGVWRKSLWMSEESRLASQGSFFFVLVAAQDFGGDFFGGVGIAGGDQFGEGTHGNLPKQRLGENRSISPGGFAQEKHDARASAFSILASCRLCATSLALPRA